MAKQYQRAETRLQEWMDAHETSDCDLAGRLEISRAHMSRLRRGIQGASKETALKLENETGIPWHTFIEPSVEAAQ
jgi:transcriptional regulator with XRE-family HTH domain